MTKKNKKKMSRNFFGRLLAHISGMAEGMKVVNTRGCGWDGAITNFRKPSQASLSFNKIF